MTAPCEVIHLQQTPDLVNSIFKAPTEGLQIRVAQAQTKFSWLDFTLHEGKNRQIR